MAEQQYGFGRAGMFKDPLAGTVSLYQRHIFVCFKDANAWPANVDKLDALPSFLAAAVKARKKDTRTKVRITVCEEGDGASNGDVFVFPDAACYRNVGISEVDSWVDEVVVKEGTWSKRAPEATSACRGYVFVCAHGSRDARCGVCGPVLVQRLQSEVTSRGWDVQVRACSHVGGHKFAGNVIIFNGSPVSGHWYGYVTPDDIPDLLDEHIAKGRIVDRLWRGQMNLTEEEQKEQLQLRQGNNRCSSCPCVESCTRRT